MKKESKVKMACLLFLYCWIWGRSGLCLSKLHWSCWRSLKLQDYRCKRAPFRLKMTPKVSLAQKSQPLWQFGCVSFNYTHCMFHYLTSLHSSCGYENTDHISFSVHCKVFCRNGILLYQILNNISEIVTILSLGRDIEWLEDRGKESDFSLIHLIFRITLYWGNNTVFSRSFFFF